MSDRLTVAFASAVNAVVSQKLFGVYEFEVVAGDSESCSLVPTDPAIGLPDMVKVPTWVSPAGEYVKYAPGVHVLIAFVNGSPARPVVVSSDASAPALEVAYTSSVKHTIEAPTVVVNASVSAEVNSPNVKLGPTAGAVLGVAYETSLVQAGPFPGTNVKGSATVKTSV